jgi:hypothetical protein
VKLPSKVNSEQKGEVALGTYSVFKIQKNIKKNNTQEFQGQLSREMNMTQLPSSRDTSLACCPLAPLLGVKSVRNLLH